MSDIAVSRKADWEKFAEAFESYHNLWGSSAVYGNQMSYQKGCLETFKSLTQELIACAEENDCGQYFKEQKLSKKDIEEIKDITMGMA
ncbi:MAG: hypothetical protein ACK5KR_05870, partial [Breznakia sp.]